MVVSGVPFVCAWALRERGVGAEVVECRVVDGEGGCEGVGGVGGEGEVGEEVRGGMGCFMGKERIWEGGGEGTGTGLVVAGSLDPRDLGSGIYVPLAG